MEVLRIVPVESAGGKEDRKGGWVGGEWVNIIQEEGEGPEKKRRKVYIIARHYLAPTQHITNMTSCNDFIQITQWQIH